LALTQCCLLSTTIIGRRDWDSYLYLELHLMVSNIVAFNALRCVTTRVLMVLSSVLSPVLTKLVGLNPRESCK
jgi:hypothetical protein